MYLSKIIKEHMADGPHHTKEKNAWPKQLLVLWKSLTLKAFKKHNCKLFITIFLHETIYLKESGLCNRVILVSPLGFEPRSLAHKSSTLPIKVKGYPPGHS